MAQYCGQCGSPVLPNASFCNICGTRVENDADANESTNANPYEANPYANWNGGAYYDASNLNVGPGFWNAFGHCMKNYCNFQGRATRTEYWGWMVVSGLIGVVLQIVLLVATLGGGADVSTSETATNFVNGIWRLAIFLPALAVMGRRLHDVGWSAKQMIRPVVFGVVGLGLLILGAEVDNDVFAIAGIAFAILALIWQAVLGITAAFVRGTDGPNKFGDKRLNPSDVGR